MFVKYVFNNIYLMYIFIFMMYIDNFDFYINNYWFWWFGCCIDFLKIDVWVWSWICVDVVDMILLIILYFYGKIWCDMILLEFYVYGSDLFIVYWLCDD